MLTLLATTLIATTSAVSSGSDKSVEHCFTPKFIFRFHDEEGYNYKCIGGGMEYALKRPEGMNVKISLITNGEKKTGLTESENTIFYRYYIDDANTLYPLMSWKFGSHKVNSSHDENFFINKSSAYIGIGWEVRIYDTFKMHLEAQWMRDIHNMLILQQNDFFSGKSYSNPFGFRTKLGMSIGWIDNFTIEIEGYYSQTFKKCYKESGFEIGFRRAF